MIDINFNYSWFDEISKRKRDYYETPITTKKTKGRTLQYQGHKNKVIAMRRKRNKQARKMRKQRRG